MPQRLRLKKQKSTAPVPDDAATSVDKHESTALVPDAPTSAGSEDDTNGGPTPKTIGCICGYTCGTAKALDKHLANFGNNPNHAPHYTFA